MTLRTNDDFTVLIAGTIKSVAQFGGGAKDRQPIAEQILGMIKSGSPKSGDRLPTEQQMGLALGISRPPLREALKALTLMGCSKVARAAATRSRIFRPAGSSRPSTRCFR
jgi:DNA-binding FadR family transcriptional regulator